MHPARSSPREDAPSAADFQLPASGLFADLEAGTGSVRLDDAFWACPPQARLGVLRGWERGLRAARLRALVMLYRETCGDAANSPLPARLAAFRGVCTRLGIELPPDFALALQRF